MATARSNQPSPTSRVVETVDLRILHHSSAVSERLAKCSPGSTDTKLGHSPTHAQIPTTAANHPKMATNAPAEYNSTPLAAAAVILLLVVLAEALRAVAELNETVVPLTTTAFWPTLMLSPSPGSDVTTAPGVSVRAGEPSSESVAPFVSERTSSPSVTTAAGEGVRVAAASVDPSRTTPPDARLTTCPPASVVSAPPTESVVLP
ncbi:hypothetical protein IWX49DRAFT_281246 [Phyllosticta citricarpa]